MKPLPPLASAADANVRSSSALPTEDSARRVREAQSGEVRAHGTLYESDGGSGAGSSAGLPAGSPFERDSYFINLLAIFGAEVHSEKVKDWASEAAQHRATAIAGFDSRLERLGACLDLERHATGVRPTVMPDLALQGWEAFDVAGLRRTHGGLLLALFHFGNHREVFLDLASLATPYVAPVAKQAYFSCSRLTAKGPVAFEEAMRLLPVEDPRVGRHLARELRAGRVGVIYVDGNMGPDGDGVDEGGVELEFFNRRIRAKEGIARLSQAFRVPVLPLFVSRPESATGRSTVTARALLPPPSSPDERRDMMQRLYDDLADVVKADPAAWEFAICLHRWVVGGPSSTPVVSSEIPAELATNPNQVALLDRDGKDYWVHVGRQRAFGMPPWAKGLHDRMAAGPERLPEVLSWLQEQGSTGADARKLLIEMLDNDLLVGVSRE